MPSTYTIISSNTLSATAASITFSAIPNTFTDLLVKASARSSNASNGFSLRVTYNGSTASNYSDVEIYATGTSVSAGIVSNNTRNNFYATNASSDTANSFGISEFYIPSYRISQNKPMGGYGMSELNATTANVIGVTGSLWRDTTAISSLTIATIGNFEIGSSFYLYGIKNS
jgi:hypothetical protein